jgi:hypothetical protein
MKQKKTLRQIVYFYQIIMPGSGNGRSA